MTMRRFRLWPVPLLLLSALLGGVGPATADDAPPPTRAVTPDGTGDVRLQPAPNAGGPALAPPPARSVDLVDLREVWIGDESDASFKIGLVAAALPDANDLDSPSRLVRFDVGGVGYRLRVGWAETNAGPNQGALQVWDAGSGSWRTLQTVEGAEDGAARALTFTLPRALVTDAAHAPVRKGDRIENVSAEARLRLDPGGWFVGGEPTGGVVLWDRAPDEGLGTPYDFVHGAPGVGPVLLHCDEPIRVTNGEQTTLVYKVELASTSSREEAYELEAKDLPGPDWTVRVPSLLRVPAGGRVAFPVIVNLPTTHAHGEYATLNLVAHSTATPEHWTQQALGVYWTDTPQPAGHHPTVWFHSAAPPPGVWNDLFGAVFPNRDAWMNPVETDPDPAATDEPIPAPINYGFAEFLFGFGAGAPPNGTQWTTGWFFPLRPALLIGLDFDPARAARFEARVRHDVPVGESRLAAVLYHCDPERVAGEGNCTTVAYGPLSDRWQPTAAGSSSGVPAAAGEAVSYEVELALNESADLLPYRRGANIGLALSLVTDRPANLLGPRPQPQLVLEEGDWRSELTLPLFEYHDPVEEAFAALGSLRLAAPGEATKRVNPAKTTVFSLGLENSGLAPEPVRLEVWGTNAAWARLPGGDRFTVAPGSTRPIELAVTPPDGTPELATAELFLVAQSERDAATVAAARLRAVVVEAVAVPDEAPGLGPPPARAEPGFETATLAVALAGLGAGLQRRAGRRR